LRLLRILGVLGKRHGRIRDRLVVPDALAALTNRFSQHARRAELVLRSRPGLAIVGLALLVVRHGLRASFAVDHRIREQPRCQPGVRRPWRAAETTRAIGRRARRDARPATWTPSRAARTARPHP